jgi:alkanesulfonate monooxygenase SsuD/methylene tetrahydromethanopterin reductase-like flavin-dependent oxidoreductase (luciferase family)
MHFLKFPMYCRNYSVFYVEVFVEGFLVRGANFSPQRSQNPFRSALQQAHHTFVSNTINFRTFVSNSRAAPYILARTYSSLDHFSNGRVGWNIVTSHSNSAAQAMGKEEVMPHDERYTAAEEYMDIVYQ